MTWAEQAEFHDNVARVANRPALDARINTVFAELSRAEIVDRLNAAKIAYGAVNNVADFAAHPQLRTVTLDTPEGELVMIAPPARVDGDTPKLGCVPALDADGGSIRNEFGG